MREPLCIWSRSFEYLFSLCSLMFLWDIQQWNQGLSLTLLPASNTLCSYWVASFTLNWGDISNLNAKFGRCPWEDCRFLKRDGGEDLWEWEVTSRGRYWEGRRDVKLQSGCNIWSNKWKRYKLLFNWKIRKIKQTFVLWRVLSFYVCFLHEKHHLATCLFRTDFMKMSYYMLRILLYPNMQYGFYSFLVSRRFLLYHSYNCAYW